MIPTLSIGPIALPTYPFSILLALWVGMWLTARRANRLGLDGDHAYNAGLYGLIAGILGARLWFVLSHWENYAPDISQAFSLSRGALAVPEGLLIAGLVVLIYLQRQRVPLGTFFDAAAPALALALALINVGAFLGGVAPGTPTDRPWAIALAGTPRHPVQLYQALAGLLLAAGLTAWPYRPWPGFQFWLFVAGYASARLGLEIFRASPEIIGDGFLAVQLGSLVSVVVALAVMAHHFTQPITETGVETYEV
jgi:phosphatidylglycerol:prolipoprotein diacylglycerol transferase